MVYSVCMHCALCFHADAAAGATYVGEQAKTHIKVAQALSLQC
jgi:hypothetical protein